MKFTMTSIDVNIPDTSRPGAKTLTIRGYVDEDNYEELYKLLIDKRHPKLVITTEEQYNLLLVNKTMME